jgi:hypothetical protein
MNDSDTVVGGFDLVHFAVALVGIDGDMFEAHKLL